MRHVLVDRPRGTLMQFVRYLAVGGVAALVDTASLQLLHAKAGMHHLSAAAIGFMLGLATNYLISAAWVFESRGKVGQELALFALIGLGGLAWTEAVLWLAVDVAGAPVLTGKVIALILVLGWNFGMRKKFVFRPGGERAASVADFS